MTGANWYFAKDNQQQGPVSESDLQQLLAFAQLPPDTLVWTEGMSGWLPAAQVPQLSSNARPLSAPQEAQPAEGQQSVAPAQYAPIVQHSEPQAQPQYGLQDQPAAQVEPFVDSSLAYSQIEQPMPSGETPVQPQPDDTSFARYTTEHPKFTDFDSAPEQFQFDQPQPETAAPQDPPAGQSAPAASATFEAQAPPQFTEGSQGQAQPVQQEWADPPQPQPLPQQQQWQADSQFQAPVQQGQFQTSSPFQAAAPNYQFSSTPQFQASANFQFPAASSGGDQGQQPVAGHGAPAAVSGFESEPDWPGDRQAVPPAPQSFNQDSGFAATAPQQQPAAGSHLAPEIMPLGTETAGEAEHLRFDDSDRFNLLKSLDAIPTPKALHGQSPFEPAPPPEKPDQTLVTGKRMAHRLFVDPTSSAHLKAVNITGHPASADPGRASFSFVTALKRFVARTLDVLLFSIPGALLYIIVYSLTLLKTKGQPDPVVMIMLSSACEFTVVAICLGIEMLVLSTWGTTPFKKILGLAVLDAQTGERPSKEQAMRRTLWLYVYLGWVVAWLPFCIGKVVTLLCTIYQFTRFMNNGATSYDVRAGVRCQSMR